MQVEVDSGFGDQTREEFSYNGLNHRVSKRHDTDLDGTLDEQRVMLYNASWQLVEEEVYEGWSSGTPGSVDERRAYIWGNRYIDDAIAMYVDTDVDDHYEDAGGSERYFYLTDAQFSVIAVMDDAANLKEKIQYDAYGRAIHHDWRDGDGDGDYDATDRSNISTIAVGANNGIGQANYEADADVDRDGDIDTNDLTLAGTTYPTALSRGELSYSDVGNTIGYDGYVFNPVTELYTVRHRTYDTELGRWLERDPAPSTRFAFAYLYVRSQPTSHNDPYGLRRMNPSYPAALTNVASKRLGTFEGQLAYYNEGEKYGAGMILTFQPDRSRFESSTCCSRIGFIQIVKEHFEPEWIEYIVPRAQREWFVDADVMWYPHMQAENDPSKQTGMNHSTMHDTPHAWIGSPPMSALNIYRFKAETCAVCRAGKSVGSIYGCIRWRFEYRWHEGDGTLFGQFWYYFRLQVNRASDGIPTGFNPGPPTRRGTLADMKGIGVTFRGLPAKNPSAKFMSTVEAQIAHLKTLDVWPSPRGGV